MANRAATIWIPGAVTALTIGVYGALYLAAPLVVPADAALTSDLKLWRCRTTGAGGSAAEPAGERLGEADAFDGRRSGK